jgi:hypothetical protein
MTASKPIGQLTTKSNAAFKRPLHHTMMGRSTAILFFLLLPPRTPQTHQQAGGKKGGGMLVPDRHPIL